MSPRPGSTRREFLQGQAAIRAAEHSLNVGSETNAGPAPTAYLLQITRRAMACEFQVFLNPSRDSDATEQAIAALDLVEQLESQMTVFRDSSEVSQLNRRAATEPVRVERRLFALLKLACEISAQTKGAFDITSGPLSKVWGFFRRQGQIAGTDELTQVLQRVGYQHLIFCDADESVRFDRPGMEINLGGIGKGYALDRCCELLSVAGIESFLVHGGQSSILARGNRAGTTGWSVGLRHPLRPDWKLGEVLLRNRALGTSGAANQFFHYEGRRLGHVLDPRTGWPAEQLLSATVLAPTAAEADAFSTAFFVLGPDDAQSICAQQPALSAILVAAGSRQGSVEVSTINLNAEEEWQAE